MNFSENTNLLPGGQSASPSKLKELDNKIDDLAQTVTSVADSVADLADEVTTAELNATSANVTNAVIDNATVGEETVTTVNATTVNADNLNATDADITNLTADDVEANSVDADNGYFGSVNAQSFTGQGVNITGDITASNKVQGKTVQATEKVVTPALESTQTELKGATTVRGDVYFPENGDKIYGEYLEVDANKVDADTVKVNSLTTETPTGSSQLVGYDNNGNLIPVDAGLDPANYWELGLVNTIQTKDNKGIIVASAIVKENAVVNGNARVKGDATVDGELLVKGDTTLNGTLETGDTTIIGDLTVSDAGDFDTTLRDTEVDGTLTVNGDIIQNGSAYETHAEKVYSKKDLIITRDGAVSGLSTGQYTGIQAKKYDGTNDGQLVFDKDGEARVGDVGDTEPLLTRDEIANMTNGCLLKWDGTNKKAVCAQSADIIPSDASTSNKLATTSSVNTALAKYGKIYKDLDTLNADKGTSIELVSGTDNCSKIVDVLNANEVFSDYFNNSMSNSKWGIGSPSGVSYVLIRFEKLDNNYCIISAYETDTNTEYFRVSKAGTLGAWQTNVKQTDLDSYTVHRVFSGYSNNNNIITFTLEDGGTYECRMYYFGGLCGIYGLARNIFGQNGAKISTIWAGSFQSYSISVNEGSGVVSMTGTEADNVLFDIYKL